MHKFNKAARRHWYNKKRVIARRFIDYEEEKWAELKASRNITYTWLDKDRTLRWSRRNDFEAPTLWNRTGSTMNTHFYRFYWESDWFLPLRQWVRRREAHESELMEFVNSGDWTQDNENP